MKRAGIFSILLFTTFISSAFSQMIFNQGDKLLFEREDLIKVATYNWPVTLIKYRITFAGNVNLEKLILTNKQSRQIVPIQLSELTKDKNQKTTANVNFLATLPSGGSYSFELSESNDSHLLVPEQAISLKKNTDITEISNGNIRIRVPNSSAKNLNEVPAPIISIDRGSGWIGENRLFSSSKKISKIESAILEQGPLFITYQVKYWFEKNGLYTANLKMISGYPFVEIEESMEGLDEVDNISLSMKWENFDPKKRWACQWDRGGEIDKIWPAIDKPIYVGSTKEDPHWVGSDWIENVSEEMIYRLTPYSGNGVREAVPFISFWDDRVGGDELGLMVYDHNKWQDNEYGIWQSTTKLSVTFSYDQGVLSWKYPLITGTRSTAISMFLASEGEKKVKEFDDVLGTISSKGAPLSPEKIQYRYLQLLHQQYSTLHLNKVKNWILSYPENAKRPNNPFVAAAKNDPNNYYKNLLKSSFVYYPLGTNVYPGVVGIDHRYVYAWAVEGYLNNFKQLSETQRKTVEALFLMSAYVNTQEDINAIRTAMAGTPNMSADGFCVPSQSAYLFPEHPMAQEWLDQYEKTIELNGLFYTRPDVKALESKGGRWTESLACYNWAYFRPVSFANMAGVYTDGKNRWANPYLSKRARWMSDMLTAPIYNPKPESRLKTKEEDWVKRKVLPDNWRQGDELIESLGFSRQYPAHGAHGYGTTLPAPFSLWETAVWMKNYDPILAENLFWTGKPGEEFESNKTHTDWARTFSEKFNLNNNGTNPHLKSVKYTGHGFVLRSGVDTPEELSIHLDQVDAGPNYRWGNQAEGGSGSIYFYARGKIYTGHENEANGDRVQNDVDGVSNFGVMKNGDYRSIGANVLEKPLYDLGVAQLAELRSNNKGKYSYSWPEYLSRSIMLVGTDYFLVFDEVGTKWRPAHRFSWAVAKDHNFPKIVFLNGKAREDHWGKAETRIAKSFHRDASGSSLVLVSHKVDEVFVEGFRENQAPLLNNPFIVEATPLKKEAFIKGVVPVKTKTSKDLVFRDGDLIEFNTTEVKFTGRSGVIRHFNDGDIHLSIFSGNLIGIGEFTFELDQDDTGLSAILEKSGQISGKFKATVNTKLSVSGLIENRNFYINGKLAHQNKLDKKVEISLPAGEYRWEFTDENPIPESPKIVRTEYLKKGVKVHLQFPDGIMNGQAEISEDGGKTWEKGNKITQSTFVINENKQEKIHVRVLSIAKGKSSVPSQEYPVYFIKELPHYPEGLNLKIAENKVSVSWGQVLGITSYRLYRREIGSKDFLKIYEGISNSFEDKNILGVQKPYLLPGKLDNLHKDRKGLIVYEYAVSSVTGKGEGVLSPIQTSDPSSWLNWYPKTDLKFKRQSAFWLPPYVESVDIPEKYYPD